MVRNVASEPIASDHTAEKCEEAPARAGDSADRRTELASDRTALAAERTYSAWIRTGLFSLASGAGAKGLLGGLMPLWIILADSSALILFSIFCYFVAVWRLSDLGASTSSRDLTRIDARILLALSSFLSVVSAAALLGIWFA